MKNTKIYQSDKELRKQFCKVSIMSGYTERLPAFINQGVDRVFDKWQVESIKKVLENCNDYYKNGGDKFKGYLHDLQKNLTAYKPHVDINEAVHNLAKESVDGYYNTDYTSFGHTYTRTVCSFLESISSSPARKKRKD